MCSKVLFVCLGNICRSPAAEEILRQLLIRQNIKNVEVASCGLGKWYIGQCPDIRMQEAAKQRGYLLKSRAQQFKPSFFKEYNYILAVNQDVLNSLKNYAQTESEKSKIYLITHFNKNYFEQDIPDPFYENDAVFEKVLDMLEDACQGILNQLKIDFIQKKSLE